MKEVDKQLPGFVLADLFRSNLVILDSESNTKPKKETALPQKPDRKWFLGDNQQKITILVQEKEAVYLQDESLQFLSNILQACKLNLGDVAIVNYVHDPVDYSYLKENLHPEHIILFGVSAKQIKLPFLVPHYQVQKHDSCSFLLAPELDKMLGNSQEAKLEKSKLWLCLKKMFGI